MFEHVLKAKLAEYGASNAIEQDNALQEVLQHYVLAGLSRSGFFAEAVFHGGTCLRIMNGIARFSEDLDFLLKKPDSAFEWRCHLESVQRDCDREGIRFEVQDKAQVESTVRKAFMKTDAIGKILSIELPFARHKAKKIRIKLEIDTNPPAGSHYETGFLDFPTTTALTVQTLESSFALKLHALLCRSYVKGRDWFDFVWYVFRKTSPNLPLLQNALRQQGPWAGSQIEASPDWLMARLDEKIHRIDWNAAQRDIQRFLPLREQEGLRLWSATFFLHHLQRLRLSANLEGESS